MRHPLILSLPKSLPFLFSLSAKRETLRLSKGKSNGILCFCVGSQVQQGKQNQSAARAKGDWKRFVSPMFPLIQPFDFHSVAAAHIHCFQEEMQKANRDQ